MKKTLGIVFILALVATPALAQKVTIDYARDFKFAEVKTFEYVETKDSNSPNELMDERIKSAIVNELTEGGLKQVDSDPDLFVTYHVTTAERTSYTTTNMGYGGYGGFYGGWGGWGSPMMGTSSTTARNYTEGTLLIDAFEPGDKKMVWRGTGTVTIKSKPEKQMKQVNKILAKLGDKWDKILAGKGK